MDTKKTYLNNYRLQEDIIRSLKRVCTENPTKSDICAVKIQECENIRIQIAEKISAVDDPRLQVLLYEKYINGHTLEEIALILNYSKRHTERLHIAALKAICI